MDISEARGASKKCVEKMEKDAAETTKTHRRRCQCLHIISSFCSVASVAFCVLLSLNAAEIRSRVVDLESGGAANGAHGSPLVQLPAYSLDELNSLIEDRVDDLLSQVRVALTRMSVLL